MSKPITEPESSGVTTIASGTSIVGEVNTNGDMRVDGNIKGNLSLKGKLVVGPTGVILGDIVCKNSDIFGRIEGKVNVTELLSLKASSQLTGDIITSKLSIEPGAKFTGTCNMNGTGQPAYGQQKS